MRYLFLVNDPEAMEFLKNKNRTITFQRIIFFYRALKVKEKLFLYYVIIYYLDHTEEPFLDIESLADTLFIKEKEIKKIIKKLERLNFLTAIEEGHDE